VSTLPSPRPLAEIHREEEDLTVEKYLSEPVRDQVSDSASELTFLFSGCNDIYVDERSVRYVAMQ